ncbi:MAG: Thiol-disulfide isomerase [Myxococcales bacterium]|nr:Thiol-disulfide isomerase [Myxococcales bacterium]
MPMAGGRALIVLISMIASATAWAETAPEDPKELFERGSALYALGRYGEAAPLFERAFELKPDPALLYNAAQAYRFNGDKRRALTLYVNYYRLYGDQIPNADDVQRQIDQLKEAIAADERAKPAPSPAPSVQPALVVTSRPPPKPLTRRPWFWGVVGGGAVVVITAVVVGIAVGTRGHSYPAATFGTVSGN